LRSAADTSTAPILVTLSSIHSSNVRFNIAGQEALVRAECVSKSAIIGRTAQRAEAEDERSQAAARRQATQDAMRRDAEVRRQAPAARSQAAYEAMQRDAEQQRQDRERIRQVTQALIA
jgi:hypothetical protein